MAISGDYSQPVQVNGFSCKNCTDVDYAKKHIDPAHPKDGPYGLSAKDDVKSDRAAAVSFGGSLAQVTGTQAHDPKTPLSTKRLLDISI